MYKEDWLGLKGLDEKGALIFKTHPGDHMQLEEEVLKEAFQEYFGPAKKDQVVFDCVSYQPSWLESWQMELEHFRNQQGGLYDLWTWWKPKGFKQGL